MATSLSNKEWEFTLLTLSLSPGSDGGDMTADRILKFKVELIRDYWY